MNLPLGRRIAPSSLKRIFAVFAIAVSARLLFCFLVYPRFLAQSSTVGTQYFFDSYREIAASIVSTCEYRLGPGGPIALHRPPGYVAVLVASAPTTSFTKMLFQTNNAILGGLAALATMWLAAQAGLSSGGRLMAALVVALWPFLVWETKVTVPENLLVLLVPLYSICLLKALRSRPIFWAGLAGACAAAATLTHALYLALVLAGALVLVLTRPGRKTLPSIAVFLAVSFVPIGLWVVRNARHGYTGVATGFGLHYWKGVYSFDLLRKDPLRYFQDNDSASNTYVSQFPELRTVPLSSNAARSDPEPNRILDRMAIAHAAARPHEFVAKVLIKAPLAWIQQQTPLRCALNGLLVLPFLALAFRGAIRLRLKAAGLVVPILVVNLAAAAVYVEGIPMRYALPWIPLVAVLAVAGLSKQETHSDGVD